MKYITFCLLLVGVVLYACKKDDLGVNTATLDETPYSLNLINQTLPAATLPQDNLLTVSKVELGRKLFFNTKLSSDGSISCASCHNQANSFSDTNKFSFGVNGSLGKRQAMAIVNMAWNNNQFFWDGRANLLRDQSLLPIQDPLEMHETLPNVIAKLNKDFMMRYDFTKAFGTSEITSERISFALEAFMLSLVSDDSKYDRYLAGTEQLTLSEERGRELFFGEYNPFFPDVSGADCAHCHAGNNFENDLYMNNGLDSDAEFTDFGREMATGNSGDRAKFKVPTLRNIAVTAPYMHDGRFNTLEEVIDHYNEHVKQSSTVDPALLGTTNTGLMLDAQEKQDLLNFLHTLTDQTFLTNPAYRDPYK